MLGYSKLTLLGSFVSLLPGLSAFQQEPAADPCPTVGAACTYLSGGVTVTSTCAPNNYCADNGATCTSDDNCYSYCGSGVCGGVGALCDTTEPFAHGQFTLACNTPSTVCNLGTGSSGTCELAPVLPSARRRSHPARSGFAFKQYNPKRESAAEPRTSTERRPGTGWMPAAQPEARGVGEIETREPSNVLAAALA